jgi:hypothetical protein
MDDKESNQKTSFFSWFFFAMKRQEGDPGKEEIPGRKV